MTTIIDAVAQNGVRGAIRILLSPSTEKSPSKPQPRYVCARTIHRSGRKGRISVYRVLEEHTDERGRKVRLYENVDEGHLDKDEQESFIGIQEITAYERGHSVRPRIGQNPPKTYGKASNEFKKPVAKTENPKIADRIRRCLQRHGDEEPNARTQAATSHPPKDRKRAMNRPVHEQRHPRSGSRSKIQGVTISLADGSNKREGKSTPHETEVLCSDAIPRPKDRTRRLRRKPHIVASQRDTQKNIATHSTVRVVEQQDQLEQEHDGSVPPEVPNSPFKQPQMTPQQSAVLVFGTGSQNTTRSDPRAAQTRSRMRMVPREGSHGSIVEEEDELVVKGLQSKLETQSQGSSLPEIQELSIDNAGADEPLISPQANQVRQSLKTPTPTSKFRLGAGRAAGRQHNPLVTNLLIGVGGSVPGSTFAQESGFFSPSGSRPAASAVFGFPSAHLDQTECSQGMMPPGTPPYTPAKSNPFQN